NFARTQPTHRPSFPPPQCWRAIGRHLLHPPAMRASQVVLKTPFVNNQITPAQYSKVAMYITTRVLASIPEQPDACGLITYGGAITKQDNGQLVSKVDYQKSSQHSIFGRFLATSQYFPNGLSLTKNLLRSGAIGTDALSTSYALGDTYLIGAHIVQAFRLSVNRIRNWQIGNSF